MLNKLIKIDLRYILRFAPIFFGAGIFFALVSLVASKIESSAIAEVIKSISENFALSAVISGIINVISRAIGIFYKKLYGDESYLTHTLPISKKTIYLSKILSTLYSFLIALFIGILILAINYNLFENFEALREFIETTAKITGGNVAEFIILIILIGFFEITTLISLIFLAMIMKNRTTKTKTAFIAAGSYLAAQGIFLLSLFLIGLGKPEVMELFNSEVVSAEAMRLVLITGIVVYGATTLIINFANIKLLEKGVNVA
ncbi:hypothetical protein IJG21_02750 [Candidatus Saccharibacteria bacterium]|nr:hypothetical protein [Candidatus Saccharibacteria bacterium]